MTDWVSWMDGFLVTMVNSDSCSFIRSYKRLDSDSVLAAVLRVCVLLLFGHLPILWWDLHRAAAKSQKNKTFKRNFVACNSK